MRIKEKRMRRAVICLIALVVLLPFLSLATDQDKATVTQLNSFSEKISYVLGQEIGNSFKESPVEIDLDIFVQGMHDSLKERKSLLDENETRQIKQEFSRQVQESRQAQMAALSEKNRAAGEAFLAANKNKEGVVTTTSGLQYKVLKKGDGPKPQKNDRVTVHYSGTLLDGTEFDSSYKREKPATFQVSGVIRGWTEALQLMHVGSKYRLFIPADLAYGKRGAGRKIGPNSMLIFDVELLGIEQ
jgi:FKBP-type peptidyl-prolyl cis-trans isomerase